MLRVACPPLLGRTYLLPRVKTVLNLYPKVELDLQIGDRFIDLIEEGTLKPRVRQNVDREAVRAF